MMIVSFFFFLGIFIAIGVSSLFFKSKNTGDYLLAGFAIFLLGKLAGFTIQDKT